MTKKSLILCTSDFVGVEAWTFHQRWGEAVLIPAGCPHQVRNKKVSMYKIYRRKKKDVFHLLTGKNVL
jgi:hypothetical protein